MQFSFWFGGHATRRRAKWALFAGFLAAMSAAPAPANAQSTADNLQKYHALRTRLTSEFLMVGPNQGQSQPADVRDDTDGFIKWADSTIRLGWYIGVLATEQYVYSQPALFPGAAKDAPQTTLDELFDALQALERLDNVADASFPSPCSTTPALNGFFIRDDVPEGFHQNFPPLTTTFSDFVDPVLTNKEMSQDQVYHLLLGLALVKRFIPDDVTVSGRGLRQWAVELARRIIEHTSDNGWVITNPACGNRQVNRGPLAMGFSGGTRLAIGFITDGAYVPDTMQTFIDLWNNPSARDPSFFVFQDVDNIHMASAIAAVADGWGPPTSEALAALGDGPDWPIYTLLHRALHGDTAVGWCKTGPAVNTRARAMLDELPIGAEPASPQPNGPAVHGFTSVNRFIRGRDVAYVGEAGSAGFRYNGLDYLLLHNLYAIVTPATWDGSSGPGLPSCTVDVGGPDAGTPPDAATPPASAAAPPPSPAADAGCGCRTTGGSDTNRFALAFALIVPLVRRPRRRRPRC